MISFTLWLLHTSRLSTWDANSFESWTLTSSHFLLCCPAWRAWESEWREGYKGWREGGRGEEEKTEGKSRRGMKEEREGVEGWEKEGEKKNEGNKWREALYPYCYLGCLYLWCWSQRCALCSFSWCPWRPRLYLPLLPSRTWHGQVPSSLPTYHTNCRPHTHMIVYTGLWLELLLNDISDLI